MMDSKRAMEIERNSQRVNSAIERMGEALATLGYRLHKANFVCELRDPIRDANAASYEAVGKAWDKLTAEIARLDEAATVIQSAFAEELAGMEALAKCVCGLNPRLSISDHETIGREYGFSCDNCDRTVGLTYSLLDAISAWNASGPRDRDPSHIANGICRPPAALGVQPNAG